jgi:hypothetical protein
MPEDMKEASQVSKIVTIKFQPNIKVFRSPFWFCISSIIDKGKGKMLINFKNISGSAVASRKVVGSPDDRGSALACSLQGDPLTERRTQNQTGIGCQVIKR